MKLLPEKIEEQRVLIAIAAINLLIRLFYTLEILNTPFAKHLYSDPKIYSDFAGVLFSANFWSGIEPFSLAPLYPLIIAVFKLVSDQNYFTLYIFQAFVGSASILFLYAAAKNIFNKDIALLSAITAALFGPYIFYSSLVSYETVEIFLVVLLVYLLSKKDNIHTLKSIFFIGLVFGILSLARESYLIISLLFIMYFLFTKDRDLKIYKKPKLVRTFIAGIIIILIPFTIINLVLSGGFTLTNTNGGINFFLANNMDAEGYFQSPTNFKYEEDLSGAALASNYLNRSISPESASYHWYKEAISELTAEPWPFIERIAVKIFMFFDPDPYPFASIYDLSFYAENFSDLLKFPFVSFGAVSILSLFGLVFYFRRSKRNKYILLLLAGYFIILIFSFVNLRFRLGITPLLIIFASFGLIQIIEVFKTNKFKALVLPSLIVFLIFFVNAFLIEKPLFNNHDAYFQFAKITEEEEHYEEAIYNYNRSILLNDHYSAFLNLGNTFAKKKDFSNALAAYGEAEKRNDNDYFLYFNKGIVLTQMGRYEEAIEAYNTSLKLNPRHYPIYRNIGIIFYVSQNYTEAQKYFNKFMSLSDDEETKALVKKDLENIRLKLRK